MEVLERLVPSTVACAESTRDLEVELFAVEREALGDAVDKRRREFVTGRACARQALARLGAPVTAIPSGGRGEPLWPAGVVGSITHCVGYRACAVARATEVAALGIDAEPNAPLPPGVVEEVAFGPELRLVAGPAPRAPDGSPVDLGRLVFSAKEAIYKAWFPLTGRWLGFEDAELCVDLEQGGFRARLLVPGPVLGGAPLTALEGRWAVANGVVCTAVVVRSPT